MKEKDTELKIKKIISEVAEIDEMEVNNEDDLVDDLGVDSMMAIEILTELEKIFEVSIPDEEVRKFTNINAICSIVNNILESE